MENQRAGVHCVSGTSIVCSITIVMYQFHREVVRERFRLSLPKCRCFIGLCNVLVREVPPYQREPSGAGDLIRSIQLFHRFTEVDDRPFARKWVMV